MLEKQNVTNTVDSPDVSVLQLKTENAQRLPSICTQSLGNRRFWSRRLCDGDTKGGRDLEGGVQTVVRWDLQTAGASC